MSSTTSLPKEENKASLFAQPYIPDQTENQNVEPEKGGCDGEREADVHSILSGELSDISGSMSDTSGDISDTSDEIFPTSDSPTKKKNHLTKIVNALKSLRPRHSDQLFYLRTEKKYFGPNSSKPNFFGSKTKAQLDSPKTSDERLTNPKKSESDTSQTENPPKSTAKISPKNSAKISTRKNSNLKESPKKTDKVMPPSKIPRISDDNGTKTTLKKSAIPSKVSKTEDSRGKTPDESQMKKEIKTVKAKPVNGKSITKQHEEAVKKRPPSAEKGPISRSRPPSEKLTDVKKPSSVQGARPSSRPAATPRVSTAKKEQDSETKKKQRLSNSTTSSTESAGERKASPEKTPISLVKDERYNPPPKVDQTLVDEAEKKKPNNLEQLEMFEDVKEQPKELSFLERLQQNVKSYFSPRGSETVRMEATVEAKKKVSDGGIHIR